MALIPAEKIRAVQAALAQLRSAADDLERALDGLVPPAAEAIAPEITEFIEQVLPEDEKQRLTEILPKLGEKDEEAPPRQS